MKHKVHFIRILLALFVVVLFSPLLAFSSDDEFSDFGVFNKFGSCGTYLEPYGTENLFGIWYNRSNGLYYVDSSEYDIDLERIRSFAKNNNQYFRSKYLLLIVLPEAKYQEVGGYETRYYDAIGFFRWDGEPIKIELKCVLKYLPAFRGKK